MKNKLLIVLTLVLVTFTTAFAQTIPNNSFETWISNTNYLKLTLTNPYTYDTTVNLIPQNWTTSDEISNGNVFGYKVLVTQNTVNPYTGTSAIQLRSDSLSALLRGLPTGFPNPYPINFVCPGFAVCGHFPIDLSAFVSLGSSFNPALLPGAGIPVSSRYSKIGGYLKYAPVGGDTAYIIAILRKGTAVVATATFTHAGNDAGYIPFEAPFVYQNCLLPDTMVYTLSSGNPYRITGVAFGNQSGLHIGSTLLVDSIYLGDTTAYGVTYPKNDSAHTHINVPIAIPVVVNDSACDNGMVAINGTTAPIHGGTVAISGDSVIYTPAAGFTGTDSFYYYTSIGTGPSSSALVVVNVASWGVGINEVANNKISVYPNPATNKLQISVTNPSVSEFRIYDMLGNVMKAENFTANTTVDISSFSNGLYIVQFTSADGKAQGSSRFTVLK